MISFVMAEVLEAEQPEATPDTDVGNQGRLFWRPEV